MNVHTKLPIRFIWFFPNVKGVKQKEKIEGCSSREQYGDTEDANKTARK